MKENNKMNIELTEYTIKDLLAMVGSDVTYIVIIWNSTPIKSYRRASAKESFDIPESRLKSRFLNFFLSDNGKTLTIEL